MHIEQEDILTAKDETVEEKILQSDEHHSNSSTLFGI